MHIGGCLEGGCGKGYKGETIGKSQGHFWGDRQIHYLECDEFIHFVKFYQITHFK